MTASEEEMSNIPVDSTRGSLLTDIQNSSNTTPMRSGTTIMALNDKTTHEVATILERPVLLGNYSWSTTDAAIPIQLTPTDYENDTQNFLQQWNFPQDILTNSPNAVDKLARYQYLKADVEIEIKWNAQPFLQGALMLVYNPYYNQVQDFRRKGTRFMASQTSCPHKIASIQEGDSFKLICPYANIYDLFDLSNSNNQFGSVFLYVFSSLIGSEAPTSITFSAFARFVNPQFFVPTHIDTMAEVKDKHQIARLTRRGLYAQSDVDPVAAPDTGETETPGPVSKVAKGVTLISEVLSNVPVIGKVASSVAWVSRAVGKTAASFGWSKPISIQPQQTMIVKPTHSLIHTEGKDDSMTLALIQDNGVDGSSFVPESVDEMAFSHALARPNVFHAVTRTSTQFSGQKLLTAWEVSPLSQYQYGNTEDSQTLYLGSFAYTAQCFATLWRGSIVYDIMVVKTQYHQGRFVVVFLPETNLEDVPSELGDLNNTNYNVICDLHSAEEVGGRTRYSVTVPYISNTPWRETYKRTSDTSNPGPDATTLDTKTGCLAIYSLNDLVFPDTVANQVTFFVSHRAGDDFELARPQLNLAPGFQSLYAQSDIGEFVLPPEENLLVPNHSPMDTTAQTTGEYFKSLRSIIKRQGVLTFLDQIADYVGLKTRSFEENATAGYRTCSRENSNDRVFPTPFYMASFLYRFYYGSSVTKVVPPTPDTTGIAYLTFDEDLAPQKVLPAIDAVGQPVIAQLQSLSNALEVRTPFYRGIRADVVNSNQAPVLGDVRTCIRLFDRSPGANTSVPSFVYEGAGDDFSFFFLIGPPPMMDIKNVDTFSTLPSGTVYEYDPVSVTNFNQNTPGFIAVGPFAVTPNNFTTAKIISAVRSTIEVTFTDATTQEFPLAGATADQASLEIPYDGPKIVDSATSVANLKAQPSIQVTVGNP